MNTRHLVIDSYGYRLGLKGLRLTVKDTDRVVLREFTLSRLKSLTISSTRVSISSDILRALGVRGIPVYLLDFQGEVVGFLSGPSFHGTAKIRQNQFKALDDTSRSYALAASILFTKIRNQRAVLSYFQKYLKKEASENLVALDSAIELLQVQSRELRKEMESPGDLTSWREHLLGREGFAAKTYWHALRLAHFLPMSFTGRTGRGATDIVNQSLNYGYSILSAQIWRAISIAGLEAYSGFLHVDRPGKPSLVLDLMEEYRPWIVDRQIIKMRSELHKEQVFSQKIRRKIIDSIHKSLRSEIYYKNHRILLETLIQRQVFRFSGAICGKKVYRGHVFKW